MNDHTFTKLDIPFTLGVDIDDTLTPYTRTLMGHVAAKHGVPVESLRIPQSYDMGDNGWPGIKTREDFLDFHNDLVRSEGFFTNSKVYPEVPGALRSLKDMGAAIKIITTRFCSDDPKDKSMVIATTAQFLYNNDLTYDEFMISHNKVDIFAHLYVDDSPSNVKKFVEAGKLIIVPDTTGYTAKTAKQFGVPLMKDWNHGVELIGQYMEEFESQKRAEARRKAYAENLKNPFVVKSAAKAKLAPVTTVKLGVPTNA